MESSGAMAAHRRPLAGRATEIDRSIPREWPTMVTLLALYVDIACCVAAKILDADL